MNERPFEHLCNRRTTFKHERCDFADGPIFYTSESEDKFELIEDVAEMIGFHATNILPELNGFRGYGGLRFARCLTKEQAAAKRGVG